MKAGAASLEGAEMDRVVHFEVPTDDMARATAFYAAVFGWELQEMRMEGGVNYTVARTTPVNDQQMPTEPGAINGGLMRRTQDTPAPVITIGVDSIDESMKKVEAEGGTV